MELIYYVRPENRSEETLPLLRPPASLKHSMVADLCQPGVDSERGATSNGNDGIAEWQRPVSAFKHQRKVSVIIVLGSKAEPAIKVP